MSVLMLVGDPRGGKWQEGEAVTGAAAGFAARLIERGLAVEIIRIGSGASARKCVGCGLCGGNGACVYGIGGVTEAAEALAAADALAVVAPLCHAGTDGMVAAFMHRLFFGKDRAFARIPAALAVHHRPGPLDLVAERARRLAEALSVERGPESVRRSRGERALEGLARYCVNARMPLAGTLYLREDGAPEKAEPLLALADDLAWLVERTAAGREAQG